MSDRPAACDRFEREGLLALERGLPLDPHFDTCPACREARSTYERLRAEIASAADDLEPPPDWQARVWAEVARREGVRRPFWRGWLVPATALAAAAVLVVALRWIQTPPAPGLAATVLAGENVLRGKAAHPGDRLELRATTGGSAEAELRIYRDDSELLLRCSTEAPCRRRGHRLEASFVLPALGAYQPLLLASDEPIVPPTGRGLDADAGAAIAAGAEVELGREILVE